MSIFPIQSPMIDTLMRTFREGFHILLISICAVIFSSSLGADEPSLNSEPLRILTTTELLSDLVKNVGGDKIVVTHIVEGKEDVHMMELRPSDLRALRQTQLVIANGLGLEGKALVDIEKLVERYEVKLVYATYGIESIRSRWEDNPDRLLGEKIHKSADPHMWHDLNRTQQYVDNIMNSLIELDPANKEYYQSNAAQYKFQIQDLHDWFQKRLKKVTKKRAIITKHPAFGYLEEAYKIKVYSLQGLLHHIEASPQKVGQLISFIRRRKVQTIFDEDLQGYSPVLDRLASSANTQVLGPLYADTLPPESTGKNSFLGMFRHNAELILAALQ